MAKKNFLLLSLEEPETRKIANVVGNDSCRKILDFLSEREATESELAEELKLPISTVHYNLQQLMSTGLVTADEFHYSKKGKEINHYKLANKYIIITPKKTWGIKEKLKSILPVVLIIGIATTVIQYFSGFFSGRQMWNSIPPAMPMAQRIYGGDLAEEAVATAAKSAAETVQDEAFRGAVNETIREGIGQNADRIAEPVITHSKSFFSHPIFSNIAFWFFIGAVFGLVAYFVAGYIRKKRKG